MPPTDPRLLADLLGGTANVGLASCKYRQNDKQADVLGKLTPGSEFATLAAAATLVRTGGTVKIGPINRILEYMLILRADGLITSSQSNHIGHRYCIRCFHLRPSTFGRSTDNILREGQTCRLFCRLLEGFGIFRLMSPEER